MEDLIEQVLSVQKNLDKSLSPEKHYHNAPWEYTSKKLPRRRSNEIGKLYTGELNDEKIPVLIKK